MFQFIRLITFSLIIIAFTFTQSNGSATWTVAHNLNKFPSVTVVLSSGDMGIADVSHQDKNNLTISFAVATSGKAYLN